MARPCPLPLADEWEDPDSYIDALLAFASSSVRFMNLCGGVHILDFLTREPDLYTTLLPEDWREFFDGHDVHDVLYLLLHENIETLREREPGGDGSESSRTWNGGTFPPSSLMEYIHNIRRLSLRRGFNLPRSNKTSLPHKLTVGMNTKKLHEVEFFSQHVASLAKTVRERRGQPVSHIVDFGSGQNYLGRTLASSPHHKHIIAIERKHQFISGAQGMDIHANLAERKKKTVYVHNRNSSTNGDDCKPEAPSSSESQLATEPHRPPTEISPAAEVSQKDQEDVTMFKMLGEISLEPDELLGSMTRKNSHRPKPEPEIDTGGKISYIEHEITDGLLEPIINHVVQPAPGEGGGSNRRSPEETSVTVHADGRQSSNAQVMVVSLHSCGNLVHHGVRSLILNPSVVAVAMIGCCYNLMTERLGPATYKLPVLRSLHPRLKETGNSYDPHGFPMSQRFETHDTHGVRGLRLNITARMMAVQAPYNWGKEESEGFFTRHFFRALLQRIFVEQGVVPPPGIPKDLYSDDPDQSIGATTALIIGSLRKSAFASFTTYARAAAAKLSRDPQHGAKVEECIGRMTDEELDDYATSHLQARKNLSIVWSLMAFSAQVVEAIIVVDRWQFLREHKSVKECWVEPVFDYALSPRNLAVMGIKK